MLLVSLLESGERSNQRDEERLQVHPAAGLSSGAHSWAHTHNTCTQELTGLFTHTPPYTDVLSCWTNELQSWPSPVPPLQLIKLKSGSGIHTNILCGCFQQLPLASHPRSWPRTCLSQLLALAQEVSSSHQLFLRQVTLLPSQASSRLTSMHQPLLSGGSTSTWRTELSCHLMRKWDK